MKLPHNDDAFAAALARASVGYPGRIVPGLRRIKTALARLGHPERRMPPCIHVAGTNGKGSTVAFADAILRAHGLRTAVYTSPHLVCFSERLRFSGVNIDLPRFEAALRTVTAVKVRLTPFEALTAAAFVLMAQSDAQAAVIETGLGGRLDATNVLRPRVCVITPIALDHVEYLGPDLTHIAREKAGILKPAVPAVCAPQVSEAAAVLHARAAALGIALQNLDALGEPPPPLALAGAHQTINAAAALTAVRLLLGAAYHADIARAALMQAQHPGRLQRLSLRDRPDLEVILDGAHNPHGAQAAAAAFAPTHLVFACGSNRSADDLLQAFAVHAPHVVTFARAPAPGLRAGLPGDTLLPDLNALPAFLHALPPRARVLITGSLYLCGAVLRMLEVNLREEASRPLSELVLKP